MKKTYLFFTLPLLFIFVAASIMENRSAFKTKEPEPTYKVYALELPQVVSFAGEKMQLQRPDLRERLDRELLVNTYWQSNMMLLLKRANKYFPVIETLLKEEGVPEDFKYLAVIESGLANVRSPKGASGFWQIMRNTGREMGLEVNSNVDERYHLEMATRVACQYLKKAKEKLGSWTLAAAAYNRGMSGIQKKLAMQEVDNYYDLYLGSETSRYLFRILAIKEIMQNPNRYGFIYETEDLYQALPIRKVGLDTAISNLAQFAKQMQTDYNQLKINNPWLLENHLNNKSRKFYEIALPVRD
ncbi:MAG: lytic transglycosylase domain-containing protein [Flavobacteriaceae bacterium]